MPKLEYWLEAEKRGLLSPKNQALLDEARRRGIVKAAGPSAPGLSQPTIQPITAPVNPVASPPSSAIPAAASASPGVMDVVRQSLGRVLPVAPVASAAASIGEPVASAMTPTVQPQQRPISQPEFRAPNPTEARFDRPDLDTGRPGVVDYLKEIPIAGETINVANEVLKTNGENGQANESLMMNLISYPVLGKALEPVTKAAQALIRNIGMKIARSKGSEAMARAAGGTLESGIVPVDLENAVAKGYLSRTESEFYRKQSPEFRNLLKEQNRVAGEGVSAARSPDPGPAAPVATPNAQPPAPVKPASIVFETKDGKRITIEDMQPVAAETPVSPAPIVPEKPLTPELKAEITPAPGQTEPVPPQAKPADISVPRTIPVLPKKSELLVKIQEAIDKAPDIISVNQTRTNPLGEYPADTPTISFQMDGGAKIYNTKAALTEFQRRIKSLPEKMKTLEDGPTIPKIGNPSGNKLEQTGLLLGAEEGYYTDGVMMARGTAPAGSKIDTANQSKIPAKVFEDILSTKTQPAEFQNFMIDRPTIPEGGVSDKPIQPPSGKTSIRPVAIIKSNNKYWKYDQGKYLHLTNRFPNAKIGVAVGEKPVLVFTENGQPVAAMMPVSEGSSRTGIAYDENPMPQSFGKSEEFIAPPPASPIKPPEEKVELGAGPFPSAEMREAIETPVGSAIENIGKFTQYWLGTKEERFQISFDKEKGTKMFEEMTKFNARVNLLKAEIEGRNKKIFLGMSKPIREYTFRVLKGIKGPDGEGGVEFGAYQPAGLIDAAGVAEGDILADNRVVGSLISEAADKRMTYRYYDTSKEYANLVQKYPQAKTVIEQYIASSENITKTKFKDDIPAFSREVMRDQYGINVTQRDGYAYVPSVPKAQAFSAKMRNLFKSFVPGGRKFKSGSLAESGRENEDLLQSYTQRQQEFSHENLFNKFAGNMIAINLKPISRGALEPGWVRVNINNPKMKRILEVNKELFKANGIDPDKASNFQYPKDLDREFKIEDSRVSGNPALQQSIDAIKTIGDNTVNAITTNYLIRPSTTVRNTSSGLIQYSLRSLTHMYEGNLVGVSYDIQGLFSPLSPAMRKRIPAAILGENFYSQIGGKKSVFQHVLIPFQAVEAYFKRATFLSELSVVSRRKFMEAVKAGKVKSSQYTEFRKDFEENYFLDAYIDMYRASGSVTYNYENKPLALEYLPKSIVPYPNYIYNKMRMYAEYSPLGLIGMNAGNARNKIAKMLAGTTLFAAAWAMVGEVADKRSKLLKKLALKRIDWKYDTTGRIKFYGDEEQTTWVRAYDQPYIGDVLYMKEIAAGNAEIGDWATDVLAMGPVFAITAMTLGLRSKYQTGKPLASLYGQAFAGFIPFGAYINYCRILADPIKRETFSKDYNAFQNFMYPIINTFPGASKMLPEDVALIGEDKGKVRQYDMTEETLKLMFLNMKRIDRQEIANYIYKQQTDGKVWQREEAARKKAREAERRK